MAQNFSMGPYQPGMMMPSLSAPLAQTTPITTPQMKVTSTEFKPPGKTSKPASKLPSPKNTQQIDAGFSEFKPSSY